MNVQKYWKAIAGALAPGATIIVASVLEDSRGGTDITEGEWWLTLATIIISGGAVLAAPRNVYPPERQVVTGTTTPPAV